MIEGGDHVFTPMEDETWVAFFTFLDEQLHEAAQLARGRGGVRP